MRFSFTLPTQKATRIIYKCLLTVFLFTSLISTAFAQGDSTFKEARNSLVTLLKMRTIDPAFTASIDHFYGRTSDSLLEANIMIGNRSMMVILTRLFDATEKNLNSGFISLLRIPAVNNYFLQTLRTYNKESIVPLYMQFGLTQSAILGSAFDGTVLGDSILSITGIREMLNAPYYISTRLSQPRYAMFRDTLLYFLANKEPETLTKSLAGGDSLITYVAGNTDNRTIKAIAALQQDVNYDRILPFALAIQQNRLSLEAVKKLSQQPEDYYKAFVDEVVHLHTSPDQEVKMFLREPLTDLNNKFANKFYISTVNDLHESPDKVRFKILENKSPQELYFMLVGGTGQIYTSSFLYTFKKFLKDTEKDGLDKFFEDIDYWQFDQFISNISGYGQVDELVKHIKPETVARLLGHSISRLASSQLTDDEIILQAMTMSDVLYALRHNTTIKTDLIKDIDANFQTPKVSNDVLLQRINTGFKSILQDKNEYSTSASYDVLPISRIKKNNKIVQACFYYDDEDGTSSFANSTATYSSSLWDKKDMGNYIVYVSKIGNDMRVYMNKPMTSVGYDTAQDQMLRDIKNEGFIPSSYIHRGHSYYLLRSLSKMEPTAEFVFLGSCGGYNEVYKLFKMNPDVNIISTRNIGSSQINDPMLAQVNSDFVNNKDIVWADEWKAFEAKFKSKHSQDLFSSYIRPDKYIGIKFIRKVFNF
ncbi:MAG: hypothetical protein ABIT96_05985 [Ferruginibacter sp.]